MKNGLPVGGFFKSEFLFFKSEFLGAKRTGEDYLTL
jgi:hypothetical protein